MEYELFVSVFNFRVLSEKRSQVKAVNNMKYEVKIRDMLALGRFDNPVMVV